MKAKHVVWAALAAAGWTGWAQASCLQRDTPDGSTAAIRVSDSEDDAYKALGYAAVDCPADDDLQARVDATCRLAALYPKNLWSSYADRFGVLPDRLCTSARLLAAEHGLVVDPAEHPPTWVSVRRAELRPGQTAADSSPATSSGVEVRP